MRNVRIKVLIVVCIMLAAALVTGCGKGNSGTAVSMFDLRTAMEEADDTLGEMMSADSSAEDAEDLFSYISDMDYTKVDKFFVSYSKEGKADEIAVIAVKDEADAADAEKSLKAHVQDRINVFTQYAPDQVKKAEKAEIFTSGKYAVLIICDKQADVKKAFTEFVSE